MSTTQLLHGDCRAQMATLPAGSVQVGSPGTELEFAL